MFKVICIFQRMLKENTLAYVRIFQKIENVGYVSSSYDDDYEVVSMHPHGPSRHFRWPQREDICCMGASGAHIGKSFSPTDNCTKYQLKTVQLCRNTFQKSKQQNVTLAVLTLHISFLISYIRGRVDLI